MIVTFLIVLTALGCFIVLALTANRLFKLAVQSAIAGTQARVVQLEKHERLIWDIAKQRAFEKLHHTDQPAFDLLLEEFRAHSMSEQQLTQFIERLEILSKDEQHRERVPAANLLLESAMLEREARHGFEGFINSAVERAENVIAGDVMAREAGDTKRE
jgi:hypothetical protein